MFLDQLLKSTLPANAMMNTRFIQQAYEKMVGHPVSYSAIYRMLKRHGWRLVGEVDMVTPQLWAAARLPLKDDLPAHGGSAMSDVTDDRLEAPMTNYTPE